MWLEDYHVDGLRLDMTLYMQNVRASNDPGGDLPDGWNLIQWINREVRELYPGRITIAEDLRNDSRITRSPNQNGAGFTAQWDAQFVHPIRAAVINADDQFPSPGIWRVRLNSDWKGYSPAFANTTCDDMPTTPILNELNPPDASHRRDGFPVEGTIQIGPYSALILSQDVD